MDVGGRNQSVSAAMEAMGTPAQILGNLTDAGATNEVVNVTGDCGTVMFSTWCVWF